MELLLYVMLHEGKVNIPKILFKVENMQAFYEWLKIKTFFHSDKDLDKWENKWKLGVE